MLMFQHEDACCCRGCNFQSQFDAALKGMGESGEI